MLIAKTKTVLVMKLIPFLTLLFLLQSLPMVSNAQTFHSLISFRMNKQAPAVSPMSIIDQMEKQLSNQFDIPTAHHSTVSILINDKVAARGTVLSGFNSSFSYLVCPRDLLGSGPILVRTNDGSLLKLKEGASMRLLSKRDNLAILRIPYTPGAISLSDLEPSSEVGSFIGILGKEESWKTGTVTNEIRSAVSKRDPRVQRSIQKHWDRIGLQVSERRSGFPEVIESDLDLLPNEAGSPVFDRSGAWQGIAIAREDRHSTFLIPALRIADLIRDFEADSQS